MDHSLEMYGNPYVKINRKISISCDTFGGFNCVVDVNAFNTKQEIINHVLDNLKNKLLENNLHILIEKLKSLMNLYHIHDFSFDDILTKDQEYYVCNHDCNTDTNNEDT